MRFRLRERRAVMLVAAPTTLISDVPEDELTE
jgi:hypothetical protein